MSDILEIFLLDYVESDNSFELGNSIQCNLALSEKSKLSDLTSDDFQRLLVETTSEYFVILERGRLGNPDPLTSAVCSLNSEDGLSCCLIPFQKNSEFNQAWNMYPARLASLVFPPEQHCALIFRKAALLDIGGFRDVSHPLWDAIIRFTAAGHSVELLDETLNDESKPQPAACIPRLTPVEPGAECQWLRSHLMDVTPEELVPQINSAVDALAVKAGLLQIHGFLAESHQCSQSTDGGGFHVAGDYWHAIMHRREPDYSNSKYWFRRVGRHPIFGNLAIQAAEILDEVNPAERDVWKERLGCGRQWDSFAFIDLCQEAVQAQDEKLVQAAEAIQWLEMLMLLESTYQDATV